MGRIREIGRMRRPYWPDEVKAGIGRWGCCPIIGLIGLICLMTGRAPDCGKCFSEATVLRANSEEDCVICAVLCCAVLCCAVLCCAVLCSRRPRKRPHTSRASASLPRLASASPQRSGKLQRAMQSESGTRSPRRHSAASSTNQPCSRSFRAQPLCSSMNYLQNIAHFLRNIKYFLFLFLKKICFHVIQKFSE